MFIHYKNQISVNLRQVLFFEKIVDDFGIECIIFNFENDRQVKWVAFDNDSIDDIYFEIIHKYTTKIQFD